jgi:hypothetical protein
VEGEWERECDTSEWDLQEGPVRRSALAESGYPMLDKGTS